MEPSPSDFDTYRADVPPSHGTAKTVGILNIIFGGDLLLCLGCCGLQVLLPAAMAPVMEAQKKQMEQAFEQQRQQALQQLKRQEDAAPTEEQKAKLREHRNALEARPIKPPDFSKLQDPRVTVFTIVAVLTGLVLNLLMMVAGIGLVSFKEWGRVLGIWVIVVKILLLVGLWGFWYLIVVAPAVTEMYVAFMKDMMENVPQPGPNPLAQQQAEMAQVFGLMYSGFGIAMLVLGVIYPVVALILLTRPGVKAACAGPPPEA